jgi:hypothetical protein
MEENQNYSSVLGSADMPYLNSLATTYAYAKSYYADTHPSIGNYFMLTTGQIITNDDGFSGTVSDDNIVRRLIKAGKTWKEYSEDLPSAGFAGAEPGPVQPILDRPSESRAAELLLHRSEQPGQRPRRVAGPGGLLAADEHRSAHPEF